MKVSTYLVKCLEKKIKFGLFTYSSSLIHSRWIIAGYKSYCKNKHVRYSFIDKRPQKKEKPLNPSLFSWPTPSAQSTKITGKNPPQKKLITTDNYLKRVTINR